MLVREYIPGDESKILELFSVVFRRKLDHEFWNWRFIENPFGRGIIRLMFDAEKLVGHYAVTPISLLVNGTLLKAALSMTTMTHPDYSRRGIFTELASEVYSSCKKKGISLIFGFPNENSYDGFTRKLGWFGFGHVKGWASQGELKRLPLDSNYIFEIIETDDEDLDDLWARARKPSSVEVPRTAEFVDWRYFQKPGREYTFCKINDKSNVLQGFLVLKLFRDGGEITCHIIDLITSASPDIQRHALAKAVQFFSDNGVTRITCWFSNHRPIAKQLHAIGFQERVWPTYYGVLVLDETVADASFVTDSNQWRFTMGDSDVF